MGKEKIILAIESSCDETAISIIKGKKNILANIVSSQIDVHKLNGGVVPELASRLHLDNVDIVFNEAIKTANIIIKDIDLIAVVNGPGLIGALHVGVIFAKTLAYVNNIPILPVHHIAGHIYANNLIADMKFPLLALVVSGGHTELVYMKEHLSFEVLGQTRDDAIGECYDKVARVLGLSYPGGPIIDEYAKTGKNNFNFPSPMFDDSYDFSYSGLKSAVINEVNKMKMKAEKININDLACSFQESAIAPLIRKTSKAIAEYEIKQVVLAGGVAANSRLRELITKEISDKFNNVEVILPPLWCCTDNAAMISSLASFYEENQYLRTYDFGVEPNKKL